MDIGRPAPADLSRNILDEVIAQKALFESLAALVPDAVVHVGSDGTVVRFNPAAVRLTGIAAEHAVGTPLRDLLLTPAPDLEAAAGGNAVVDLAFRGSGARMTARIREVRAGEGFLLLIGAQQRFAELEQLKRELLSAVSHELKTPLASIKAYVATLRSNPGLDAERYTEFLSIVESQADRLARLIDDILVAGRVESGQLIRERVRIPLDTVLDRALELIPRDEQRHPVVREGTATEISGDPDRLCDLFRNLIENAVKYSPNGGPIRIAARRDTNHSVVELADRGIGIDAEDLPYIFDRFFRSDDAAARAASGSGLGLYLAQALVHAHGGAIDVRSSRGEGTTFLVRLPLR